MIKSSRAFVLLVNQKTQARKTIITQLVHDVHNLFVGHLAISSNDDRVLVGCKGMNIVDQIFRGGRLKIVVRIAQTYRQLSIFVKLYFYRNGGNLGGFAYCGQVNDARSEEHTSELQSRFEL